MSTPDQAWWARARQARGRLEALVAATPDVRMVSIGLDPQRLSDEPVLVVHVRHSHARLPDLPEEIDGMPVRVSYGDYQIEQGEP